MGTAAVLFGTRGYGASEIRFSSHHSLNEGARLYRGLAQIRRKDEEEARRPIGVVAHRRDLHPCLNGGGSASLNRMADNNCARCTRIGTRVVV